MIEDFPLARTTECGCTPESDKLRGSYVDGPVVSAVLDLRKWKDFAAWRDAVTRQHGGGWGYYLRRAVKAGLTVEKFERATWESDWCSIDHSKAVRQGREMSASYRKTLEERGGEPTTWRDPGPIACALHWRMCLGVFAPAPKRIVAGREVEKQLVAYASLIRTDNLIIDSMLLGHSNWLNQGAIPALYVTLLAMLKVDQEKCTPAVRGVEGILYAGWNDGQAGLRAWKANAGFEPRRLVAMTANVGGAR